MDLCSTDTDSLILFLQTDDIYRNLEKIQNIFMTSATTPKITFCIIQIMQVFWRNSRMNVKAQLCMSLLDSNITFTPIVMKTYHPPRRKKSKLQREYRRRQSSIVYVMNITNNVFLPGRILCTGWTQYAVLNIISL